MAAATATAKTPPPLNRHITCSSSSSTTAKPPRPKLACFSFAAYAKAVIDHLKSLQIPVLPGLSDPEFTSLESTFRFSFPPDLRSILQEGLPVGPGFPNWRSSSVQQLHILINLPKFCILKEISQRNYWPQSWGARPDEPDDAVSLANGFLEKVPVLVPIYRNCYIPSVPNVAGNPVFLVNGEEIRVLSFDLAGFFQNHQYCQFGEAEAEQSGISSPAWAATEARAVDFWTEVAAGKRVAARGWWSEGESEMGLGLDGCLEEVFWKLREGGWREEDVRDMMMMDGQDHSTKQSGPTIDERRVCEMLLSGGWSREDVVYSLDLQDNSAKAIPEEESTFEINIHSPIRNTHVERKKKPTKTTNNNIQMPPFFFAPYRNLIL